jgi:hypothetical protein
MVHPIGIDNPFTSIYRIAGFGVSRDLIDPPVGLCNVFSPETS